MVNLKKLVDLQLLVKKLYQVQQEHNILLQILKEENMQMVYNKQLKLKKDLKKFQMLQRLLLVLHINLYSEIVVLWLE